MSPLDRGWVRHSQEIAAEGDLEITGRLVDASNATLFGTVTLGKENFQVIYKPVAGERPLWDFVDGTLADREYAAFLLSDVTGFDLVPPTILREGPAGFGMVQRWIDIDESIELAQFFANDFPALRELAIFDAIVNNTDRKIGHLLPAKDLEVHAKQRLRCAVVCRKPNDLKHARPRLIHCLPRLRRGRRPTPGYWFEWLQACRWQ